MFDGIYRNQSLIILDFMILDFKFQPHKSDSQLETCNSPKVNSMRREWITKEGSRMLTLFFCGWGMDERAVQHVKGKGDLLLLLYSLYQSEEVSVFGWHIKDMEFGLWFVKLYLVA